MKRWSPLAIKAIVTAPIESKCICKCASLLDSKRAAVILTKLDLQHHCMRMHFAEAPTKFFARGIEWRLACCLELNTRLPQQHGCTMRVKAVVTAEPQRFGNAWNLGVRET